MKNCCTSKKDSFDLNITKIVRYVCTASVLIVAIIFGTNCYLKSIGMNHSDQ